MKKKNPTNKISPVAQAFHYISQGEKLGDQVSEVSWTEKGSDFRSQGSQSQEVFAPFLLAFC